jgi:hypothetical protein
MWWKRWINEFVILLRDFFVRQEKVLEVVAGALRREHFDAA